MTKASPHSSVSETLNRLQETVRERSLDVFDLIYNSAAAEQVGLTMQEAELLICGTDAHITENKSRMNGAPTNNNTRRKDRDAETQLFYSGPSIEVLHEEYAKKGRIDGKAAVNASHEVRIEVPVERVWELLSDVPGWETWYPDVHDIHLDSGVKADASFTWRNGKSHIKSRFAVVDAQREITWAGISSGAKAVDRNVLEPTDGGGATRVFCEESMTGPLLVLFFDSAKLKAGMEEWLSALKTAAEGR